MKFAPYSYSKIDTFDACPKRFKFAYIDKVKPISEQPHFVKGRRLHKIFEKYENYVSDLDDLSAKYPKEFKIATEFMRSSASKKVRDAVLGNIKSLKECKVGIDKHFEPCLYSSKDCLFRGICDLVFIRDNTLTICDYKTGKAKDEKYQDYRQLIFYGIYFFKKNCKIKTIEINYIYVEHNIVNALALDRKYLNNYIRMLCDDIVKIETATNYHENHKFCQWCPYASLCAGAAAK